MALSITFSPAKILTTKTNILESPKTFILEQCKSIKDVNQVHANLIKTGGIRRPEAAEPLLESAALFLLDSSIEYAVSIFGALEEPHCSAYNVMIRAFTNRGFPEKAIVLFRQMVEQKVQPDEFTFSCILKACSRIKGIKEGEQIHAHVVKCWNMLESREFVENALMYLYVSCGKGELARHMFDEMPEKSVMVWNAMFSGYVKCGYWEEVVMLFRKMLEEDVHPDEVTLISVLNACGRVGDLDLGEQIHEYAKVNGLMMKVRLVTSLVDMYAKCGCVDIARDLFYKMQKKDVVAWSAMISGYTQANKCREALALFHDMQRANVEPNEVTMVSVISSCVVLGALETGKWVHSYIKKKRLKLPITLRTALLDFYAKCGCMDTAIAVFREMPSRNVWAWTAVIQGLASHGQGERALEFYHLMLRERVTPNDVSFIGVLHACSHAGLIQKGHDIFFSMGRDFGVEPKIEHYGCMVDMLGRAGLVEEAYQFVQNMPIKPNAVIWRTLLASCRVHKNVEIGEESLKQILRLEPPQSTDYILLSYLYASVGRSKAALRLRNEMKAFGIQKSPGGSSIELDGTIHEFLAEDNAHPQLAEVYKATENMMKKIKLAGYVPNKAEARLDAEEDDKEASVSHHSEKLAIAFGLIRTSPGTTLRISKNLRICTDCHNAAKTISKVYDREIIIRDRSRFHRFKDGFCSCNDFW